MMKFGILLPVAAMAVACAASMANPPAGIFTEVSPIAKRYPVTLKAVQMGTDSPCWYGKELQLYDDTGKPVEDDPFVVPDFQKFVLTDISWKAKPPVGQTFKPEGYVELVVQSYHPAWGGIGETADIYAQKMTSQFATGNVSYQSGPAYVAGTALCVRANFEDGLGGWFDTQYFEAMVHGYIQEDDAKP